MTVGGALGIRLENHAGIAMDTGSQKDPSVVVITEGGPHVWAIINALDDRFPHVKVILESPESKSELLKRRARRQGWISVFGQLGTMVLIKLTKRFQAARTARIAALNWLETGPRPEQDIVEVPSANSPECLAAVHEESPGVVFLIGCRLLAKQTLGQMPCPVINYHAGITPKYRGMNGGYWALAEGDAENFGSTVHLVDAGVDTGGVLLQVRGKPEKGDNISTYALRQAAFSRDMCVEAVADVLAGYVDTFDPELPSRQWYHPTIWSYLWTGFRRGVW